MTVSDSAVWTDTYKIHSYDVDRTARLTVSRLCGFLQESAWNHAEHLGVGYTHLSRKGLLWVLSRQFIQIPELPVWGDSIIVKTWPSGMDRISCYRDFCVLNKNDKPLVRATSTWFAIDMDTRRPKPPETYFTEDILTKPSQFDRLRKIHELQMPDASVTTRVKYHDLDVNGHVNNVKFAEWCVGSMPLSFLNEHKVSEIEINFLAEAFYDDLLTIKYSKTEDLSYLYSVLIDENEICRSRISWMSSES